jgi:hypothetical protein
MFAIPGATSTVTINNDYRQPVAMQINRETRARIATTYYGKKTFVVASDPVCVSHIPVMQTLTIGELRQDAQKHMLTQRLADLAREVAALSTIRSSRPDHDDQIKQGKPSLR